MMETPLLVLTPEYFQWGVPHSTVATLPLPRLFCVPPPPSRGCMACMHIPFSLWRLGLLGPRRRGGKGCGWHWGCGYGGGRRCVVAAASIARKTEAFVISFVAVVFFSLVMVFCFCCCEASVLFVGSG